MAQPQALLVKRVRRDGIAVLADVVDGNGGPEQTLTLEQLNRGTLVRAAMNVGITAGAINGYRSWGEWTDDQKRDAITAAVMADDYAPREFVPSSRAAREAVVTTTAVETTATSAAAGTAGTSLVKQATAAAPTDATAAALAALVATLTPAAPAIDEAAVRAMVTAAMGTELDARIAHLAPRVTNITFGTRETVTLEGRQHAQFEELLSVLVDDREHAYLYGPPGTGKTTLAMNVAKALSLPFRSISCSPDMMSSRLIGYMDANGKYVRTAFRDWFEYGGIFLLDEGDNATGSILTTLNQSLSNGSMQFPDEHVERHDDAYLCLAANTFGTGPTAQFAGRSALDAATLDRFARIAVPVDETLEREMVHAVWNDTVKADRWIADVRRYRANVESLGLKVFITPRFAVRGAKMLKRGVAQNEAEMTAGLCAVPADQVAKIRGAK
jgi:cobaltochelatase CobS